MNEFKLKGKVLSVDVIEEGKVTKVDVEVNSNNRTEVIPVMTFNKLSVIVARYIKNGACVDVVGALRWNYRTKEVEPVVFKIAESERTNKPKVIKEVKEVCEESTVTVKKEQKKETKVINGPVKKVDRFEGFVLNIYDNVSKAAEDVKVKKSDLKKAIENGSVLAGFKWSL